MAYIPDSLWQTAAELFHTGSYSLHTLSKTLRVNHTSLKNHVQHQESEAVDVSGPSPAFIELKPAPSSNLSECVIEMEDAAGAKMRMCFRGKADPGLIELGKAFWRKQP